MHKLAPSTWLGCDRHHTKATKVRVAGGFGYGFCSASSFFLARERT